MTTPYTGAPLLQAMTDYLGNTGTDYLAQDGTLACNKPIRFADITDGSSNTLLAGERSHSKKLTFGAWFAGCGQYDSGLPHGDRQRGSADVVLGTREINSQQNDDADLNLCPRGPYHFQPPGQVRDLTGALQPECDQFHFWSYHPGGANFLLADGSVHFLGYAADTVLPALGTREGGETVSLP
jgi:prepilin-type processing-associated H-X9-DG protein